MAPTILQSLELAAPRPQTAYYSEVSEQPAADATTRRAR